MEQLSGHHSMGVSLLVNTTMVKFLKEVDMKTISSWIPNGKNLWDLTIKIRLVKDSEILQHLLKNLALLKLNYHWLGASQTEM